MLDQPFISVIVPNYNYEAYVADCIRSVLDQDYAAFEIIVVDDGSRDNSWAVIESFGDRIQALRVENGGALKACLTATDRARGDYIYILDSDDRLCRRDALSLIARACAQRPSKVQFPLRPIDAGGAVIGPSFPDLPVTLKSRDLIELVFANGSYMTPPTSGNVYRRDLWEVAREVQYESWTDGIVYLLCPFRGEVVTLPQPLAEYRVHGRNDSSTRSMSERIASEVDRFTQRLDHLRSLLPAEQAKKIRPADSYFFVAERKLLQSSLDGRQIGGPMLIGAVRSLLKERQNRRRAALWLTWLTCLAVVPKNLRRKIALFRDKPHQRPKLLKALKRLS